ncbi:MAG: fibronectin type III domain-containing protein, partial [Bacteroidales bacterium]|nr:fibronectin type III domain-containing protein [Bacteroidales bacterium]
MKQTSLLFILLLALFAPGMANAQIIGVGGFPWTENFDSSSSATAHDTNALPDNWNYYNGTNSIYSGYPLIYNSSDYAHSGNHFLRFFSYYETDQDYTYTDQYAMLPAMQNVNHLRISFYARLGNDDYESSLVLGVMSDPADITTFDAIKTINPTSTNYELFTINLNKYTGTGSYIAFKMAPATENNHFYIICVDDITVEELPSCLEPSELKANQITSTSAKLSWESNGDEDSWTIYYKKSTDNAYTSVSVTDNPHTLSGLQSSTTYEYYVVANCSETDISEPSATISFTTYCDAVTAFPWTENFDSHTGSTSASSNNLPECWYYYNGTTNNNDNAGYPIIYDNSTNAHSGNNSLKFYSSYSSTQDDILYDNTDQYCILPAMEDVSSLRIKFYACQLSPVFNSYLVVGVMTNPEDISTFKAVSTITPASTTYELYEVHFDAYTDGGSFIAIMMPPANSVNIYRGIYVDDITVGEIPTCLEPTHLEANANSSSSANLSWDANNDEGSWTLYYKKSTDDAYTSVTVDSNPYTLSGLEAYTNYEYYVVAHCSETDLSEPSAVESFLTLCEALDEYPYTENFDGITGSNSGSNNVLPLCWQRVNTTTYGYYSGYPTVYADYASLLYSNSTPNCLRFFSLYRENQSYDPQPQYVILPEMQNLAGKKITLSAKGGNSTSYFKIGTMTDPTDTNTFSLIAEQELTTSYQEFVFYIPKYATTTPRFVAIMIDAANANKNEIEVFVDDISIDVEPCLTPYNLT